MTYWVKRIALKTGEIVTERELQAHENLFDGQVPMAGDKLTVICRGRIFEAKVLVGHFPGRPEPEPGIIYPIRVEEI